jgi:hypothetical protein
MMFDNCLLLKPELDLISETKWVWCLYHFYSAYLHSFAHSHIYLAHTADCGEYIVATYPLAILHHI